MRKSKSRKAEKRTKSKVASKLKKEIRAKKKANKKKYKKWLELPISEYSEQRKKHIVKEEKI